MQQTDLFQARHGGYHSYRIPGLVVSARGTILAFCEARRDSPWDHGRIDILLRRSLDGGATWSAPRVLVAGEPEGANNAVMIADPTNGDIHFLYCLDYKRCFYSKSGDDGATFSPPTEITAVLEAYRAEYNWELAATGPGHGLLLRGGRLLIPVWFSTSREQTPTMASVIYSDDNGAMWQRGPIIVQDGDGQGVANPMEPVAIELEDGRVLLNIRNASPQQRRAVTISPDGVHNWSPLRFDGQLPDPFCLGSVCRVSSQPRDAENAILFAGPANLTDATQLGTATVGGSDRKRLTICLSRNEGQTWPKTRILEPGWSGYCDLAVGPDKTIYCLYESGCIEGFMWDVAALRLARFERAWIEKAG